MIFALLLSYGDISFNTRIQQIDRTIQVSVLTKYLYDTLDFEFDNILKYSQTNQRILKHFIKEGTLPISKSSESKSVINRFSKNTKLLKNYSEMFSLYEWKKSAYDIYKESILKDDKYFHKILESENKLLGFAWGFSVMAGGPVEFMSDNANALKSLTLHDNGFNVSSQYIVKDNFSRDDFDDVMVELVACQKRLFDEMNIII
jgi:hypothetical protein